MSPLTMYCFVVKFAPYQKYVGGDVMFAYGTENPPLLTHDKFPELSLWRREFVPGLPNAPNEPMYGGIPDNYVAQLM